MKNTLQSGGLVAFLKGYSLADSDLDLSSDEDTGRDTEIEREGACVNRVGLVE